MSKKELEAKLEDISKLLYEVYDVPSGICEYINKALLESKKIKESNPSEALEKFDYIGNDIIFAYDDDYVSYDYTDDVEYIKQALIKAQVQEKVLSIIKEYQVDIWLLKQCDYENYIRIRKEALISVGQIVNENGNILEDEITKEEFDTLKRWIG